MAKQEVVEGFKFEQRHGKERVRVARVWKTRQGQHFIVEWRVGITLFSDCVNSYLRDDNSDIVATDTMKNTVTTLTFSVLSHPLFFYYFSFCQFLLLISVHEGQSYFLVLVHVSVKLNLCRTGNVCLWLCESTMSFTT